MDTMSNLDMTVRNEEDRNTDEINLNRAIYLLQHGSLDTNSMFLLNYAHTVDLSFRFSYIQIRPTFSIVSSNVARIKCFFTFQKDSTKTTNMCRVRALQCLFALVDNKTIENICQTSVEEVR